jgi:hypothetical protein
MDNTFYIPYPRNTVETSYRPAWVKPTRVVKEKSPTAKTCGASPNASTCSMPESKVTPHILNPMFNLREVAKQCILLEDHLYHVNKRCADCIKKHCLFIEGLLEEAITLDTIGDVRPACKQLVHEFKDISSILMDTSTTTDGQLCAAAQQLRQFRKKIMNDPSVCKFMG